MYCPHCQIPLENGTAFCPSCGRQVNAPPSSIPDLSAVPMDMPQNYPQSPTTPQTSAPQQNVTQSVVIQPMIMTPGYQAPDPYAQYQHRSAMRQTEIKVLGEVIRHFSSHQGDYDAYDNNTRRLLYYARGASSALLVWGIILTVLGLFFTGMFAEFGMVFWVPGILMTLGGILMKVNNHSKMNSCLRNHKQLTQELYQHYLKYTNCPVGPEYSNPRVLQILMEILQSGRCDTIKEAINCMLAGANQKVVPQYYQQMQRHTTLANAEIGINVIFASGQLYRS